MNETKIEEIPPVALLASLFILMLPATALSTEYQRAEEIAAASAVDAPAGLEDMEKAPKARNIPIKRA